jgi:hypothetical protein
MNQIRKNSLHPGICSFFSMVEDVFNINRSSKMLQKELGKAKVDIDMGFAVVRGVGGRPVYMESLS